MTKILILAGGYSNEREISLITATSVTKELKKNKKYKLLTIEPNGYFIKKLRKFRPKKSYFTDIMCAVDHDEANLKLKKLNDSEGLDIELSYDGLSIKFNY